MNRTLKLVLLTALKYLGLFRLARFLTHRRGFTIIGWHGVSIHDEHVRNPQYFIRPETLRKRLQYLNKHFQFVSLDEAMKQLRERRIQPNQVVLTFDDGMYDFAARAVRILRQFGAPATVYVLSGNVQNGAPAYPIIIRDMIYRSPIRHTNGGVAGVKGPTSLEGKNRELWAEALQSAFHQLPTDPNSQDRFVRDLAAELHVDLGSQWNERIWHYLTPQEVRQLSDEGVSMQVHTHTHRTVVQWPDSVYDEVSSCREYLEEITGQPARHFCYPSGLWKREAWGQLEKAGMVSAATCNVGPNFADTPALALRRCIDGESKSQLEFEFVVSGLRWLIHAILHPPQRHVPREVCTVHGPFI
jgi:peptidoglycan/xylan/chitin deacetylase (PgdA/CDA1 family)